MKTITEILAGAQALLNVDFKLQQCFEEYLSDDYKAFMHIVRVAETYLPNCHRRRAMTGRPAYAYSPYIRSMLAKSFFGIEKTSSLIQHLKADPNLRLLCGFRKVPHAASFSRAFSSLANAGLWESGLEQLVKKAHEGKVV